MNIDGSRVTIITVYGCMTPSSPLGVIQSFLRSQSAGPRVVMSLLCQHLNFPGSRTKPGQGCWSTRSSNPGRLSTTQVESGGQSSGLKMTTPSPLFHRLPYPQTSIRSCHGTLYFHNVYQSWPVTRDLPNEARGQQCKRDGAMPERPSVLPLTLNVPTMVACHAIAMIILVPL
jgi:hypothetical protein